MNLVNISELRFYPGNARRGDIDLIAESLAKLGHYKPIVANADGTILAGNHTVMAAQRLGWEQIDVHWVDVGDDTAKRIVLVDNKSNDVSTYDVEELVNLLTELPDLDATGFTRDELDDLLELTRQLGRGCTGETGCPPNLRALTCWSNWAMQRSRPGSKQNYWLRGSR